MELVTGNTGIAHVTAIDDAMRNSHMASSDRDSNYGQVVFDVPHNAQPNRRAFYAEAITANEVRVYAGYGSNQGRLFKINENSYDSVPIKSGKLNIKRMDLITARYVKSAVDETESVSLHVIEGEEGNDYTMPTPLASNINGVISGEVIDDFVLYKVYIDETRIDHIEACFTPLPDGGLIGICMNKMAEIEADIERIPFDLGDAVNKTYVDNVAHAGAKNYVIPHQIAGYAEHISDASFSTGFMGGISNGFEISANETATTNERYIRPLTYAWLPSEGECRLYVAPISGEYKPWMHSVQIAILDYNDEPLATINLTADCSDEEVFDIGDNGGIRKICMIIPQGLAITEDDEFRFYLNVCDSAYKGFKNIEPNVPIECIIDALEAPSRESVHGALSEAFYSLNNDNGTANVKIGYARTNGEINYYFKTIDSQGNLSLEQTMTQREYTDFKDCEILRFELSNGQLIDTKKREFGLVLSFADSNGNIAHRAFTGVQNATENGTEYVYTLKALKKVDSAFSGDAYIRRVYTMLPQKVEYLQYVD